MRLSTVNTILIKIGLVLVVSIDNDDINTLEFWIERFSTYQKRCDKLRETLNG